MCDELAVIPAPTYADICRRAFMPVTSNTNINVDIQVNSTWEPMRSSEKLSETNFILNRYNSPLPSSPRVRYGVGIGDGWQQVRYRTRLSSPATTFATTRSHQSHGTNHHHHRSSPKLSFTKANVHNRPSSRNSLSTQHQPRPSPGDVRKTFLANNPTYQKDCSVIDLHGLNVRQALPVFAEHIIRCKAERVQETVIITGWGAHSARGKPKLRPNVLAFLRADSGVEARVHILNEGRIHVILPRGHY